MQRGGKLILCSAALAVSACVADNGQLNVRAIADPFTKATKSGNPMVVEGRNLLALGSVGVALEAFRKAQRDDPNSFEAIAGIAECYERMGRYDVARRKYEEALAIAPDNPVLLNTFAASLERQGLRAEAMAVRAEADNAEAASVAVLAASAAQTTALVVAQAAQAAPPTPKPALTKAEPVSVTTWTFEPSPVSMAHAAPAARAQALAADSVTVSIRAEEEAAPVVTPTPASRSPTIRVAQVPAARPQAKAKSLLQVGHSQPRLERLSLGEVALVTSGGPIWQPQVVAQSRQSVTVRFVPLQRAAGPANVRVLNAARQDGIAAKTRQVLLDRGWRRIQIGDAPAMRESSLVLYPANRKLLGRSLAAQFGFRSQLSNESRELIVLIGRDAVVASGRSRA